MVLLPIFKGIELEALPLLTDVPFTCKLAFVFATVGVTVILVIAFKTFEV